MEARSEIVTDCPAVRAMVPRLPNRATCLLCGWRFRPTFRPSLSRQQSLAGGRNRNAASLAIVGGAAVRSSRRFQVSQSGSNVDMSGVTTGICTEILPRCSCRFRLPRAAFEESSVSRPRERSPLSRTLSALVMVTLPHGRK